MHESAKQEKAAFKLQVEEDQTSQDKVIRGFVVRV